MDLPCLRRVWSPRSASGQHTLSRDTSAAWKPRWPEAGCSDLLCSLPRSSPLSLHLSPGKPVLPPPGGGLCTHQPEAQVPPPGRSLLGSHQVELTAQHQWSPNKLLLPSGPWQVSPGWQVTPRPSIFKCLILLTLHSSPRPPSQKGLLCPAA